MTDAFRRFSDAASGWAGSPAFFALNLAAVAVFFGWGFVAGFSDTLQLVMTTGLTIVTQLMVVLIQGSQNRDGRAVHLKLDELLRAVADARTDLAGAEDMAEEQVERAITEIKGED